MVEEELALGDDEELSVGDPGEELSLDGEISQSTDSTTEKVQVDGAALGVQLPLEEVEKLLLGGKLPAEKIVDYTKRNLSIYRPFGLRRFQDPDAGDLDRIHRWVDAWREKADVQWGKNQAERRDDFNSALNQALRLFEEKSLLKPGLKELVHTNLAAMVKGKLGDGKIDPLEMKELIETAREEGLWVDEESKKEVLARIEKTVKEEKARLVDYTQDFLEKLKEKKPIERMDSDDTRAVLLDEFRRLKEAHQFVYGHGERAGADGLIQEMRQLMQTAGLDLIPKTRLFEENFLSDFLQQKKIDFSVPLSTDDFYQIKSAATNQFQFTSEDWEKYSEKKNIRKKPEVGIKFNFGKDQANNRLEADSFEEIVKLFESDNDKAIRKIYEGDLENYLQDSGHLDLEKKIQGITKDYKDDQRAGLKKTIFTLLPDSPFLIAGYGPCKSPEEVALGIEKKSADFLHSLVGAKNHEVQLWLEARGQESLAEEFKSLNNAHATGKEKRLNGLVWLLERKNFRRNGTTFYSPHELVELPVGDFKNELAKELFNENSKLTVWIEVKFSGLVDNVNKWRKLNRINAFTLTYALEKNAPFHFQSESLGSALDVQSYVFRNALKDGVIDPLTKASPFREELQFWLMNYQKTDVDAILLAYLKQSQKLREHQKPFTQTIAFLSQSKLEAVPLEQYWYEFVPLYDAARLNFAVSADEYDAHKKRLLKALNKKPSQALDQIIQKYLESGLNNPEVDKDFVYSLFKYFSRASVARDYYINSIQPLLLLAIERKFVPEQAMEEQRKFFIAKYEQDLPQLQVADQVATLEAIRKLAPEHKLVVLYDQSVVQAKKALQEKNKRVSLSNSSRRDLVLLLCVLATTLGVFATNLFRWLHWPVWESPTMLIGEIAFWTLVLGAVVGIIVLQKMKKRRK